MRFAYFVHELADPAVRRRVSMIEAGGGTVALLGFERERGVSSTPPARGHVLGRTRNRQLIARLPALLLAIPRALSVKAQWRNASTIVARNLEMLALVRVLALLTGSRARIIYECLDIHRLMLSTAPLGACLRAIERTCLRRVSLVLTSSPAFERFYFRDKQKCSNEVLVVENKIPGSATPQAPHRSAGPPWTIAWCGVLRCRRSLEILAATARAGEGRVRVELWGKPALDQIPDFHEIVAGEPNIAFRGNYTAEQLPAIYGVAHFAWAIDYYEAGGNSDWLLPNRLYESLAFGAIPIAAEGVETARWLKRNGVGRVLRDPSSVSLLTTMDLMTGDKYTQLSESVAHLEARVTRFSNEDCVELVARIAGARA